MLRRFMSTKKPQVDGVNQKTFFLKELEKLTLCDWIAIWYGGFGICIGVEIFRINVWNPFDPFNTQYKKRLREAEETHKRLFGDSLK